MSESRNIIEQRPISIPEVKAILDKLMAQERDVKPETERPAVGEGGDGETPLLEAQETEEKRYYLKSTFEYVQKFAKMDARVARNLVSKLVEEQGVDPLIAIQIVNIGADSVEELGLVFEKSVKRPSKDELDNLLFKIREYKEL